MDLSQFKQPIKKQEETSPPPADNKPSLSPEEIKRKQQEDLDAKRKALMNLSFSTLDDKNLNVLVDKLPPLDPRQGSAVAALKYYLVKYNLPDLIPVLDSLVVYRGNNKNSIKALIDFKRFGAMFDLFKQNSIKKET